MAVHGHRCCLPAEWLDWPGLGGVPDGGRPPHQTTEPNQPAGRQTLAAVDGREVAARAAGRSVPQQIRRSAGATAAVGLRRANGPGPPWRPNYSGQSTEDSCHWPVASANLPAALAQARSQSRHQPQQCPSAGRSAAPAGQKGDNRRLLIGLWGALDAGHPAGQQPGSQQGRQRKHPQLERFRHPTRFDNGAAQPAAG
jgi:hypothetical protein